jgi:hypothetical protein
MNFWRKAARVMLTAVAATLASVGTLAVTAAGFTLSFDAIRAVAVAAHIRPSWAWMMPVAVDGSMAVATVVAIVLYKITGKHRIYPWLVLAVGILVSMASNGLHATGELGVPVTLDTSVRVAVATVPAVMLALSFHLLATLVSIVSETVSKPEVRSEDRSGQDFGQPTPLDFGQVRSEDRAQTPDLTFTGHDVQRPMALSDFSVPRSEDTADLSKVQAAEDNALDTAGQELVQETVSYLSRLAEDIGQDKVSVQPVAVDKVRGQSSRGLTPAEIGQVRDLMTWGRAAGLSSVGDLRAWVAGEYGVSPKTVQRAE